MSVSTSGLGRQGANHIIAHGLRVSSVPGAGLSACPVNARHVFSGHPGMGHYCSLWVRKQELAEGHPPLKLRLQQRCDSPGAPAETAAGTGTRGGAVNCKLESRLLALPLSAC